MKNSRHMILTGGALVASALGYYSTRGPITPPTSPLPTRLDVFAGAFISHAEADTCGSGVRTSKIIWKPDPQSGGTCASGTVVCPFIHTEGCETNEPDIPINGSDYRCKCFDPVNCPGIDGPGTPPEMTWIIPAQGCQPPCSMCNLPPRPVELCDPSAQSCPIAEQPSCEDDQDPKTNAAGDPVACGGDANAKGLGSLFYEVPVFSTPAAGFRGFSVFYLGQGYYEANGVMPPLGSRLMHSLAPSIVYVPGAPARSIAWTENGGVIPFEEVAPQVWQAEDGRVATLSIQSEPGCSGTAILTIGDGTKYTFGEIGNTPCNDEISEGRISRIDRPDGEYLIFDANDAGLISTVTNRRLQSVSLEHFYEDGLATTGILKSVVAPDGQRYTFSYQADYLRWIRLGDETGPALWDFNFGVTAGGTHKALLGVEDANKHVENNWEYDDANSTRVQREWGPGGSRFWQANPTTLKFIYDSPNSQATVEFRSADGATTQNTWTYSSQFAGDRPRVTSRSNDGACPGCGTNGVDQVYWTGTSWPRRVRDADGRVTVFQDLAACPFHDESCDEDDPAQRNLAYSVGGNPLVVYEGCTGSSIDSVDCSTARRGTFTYKVGTRAIETATRPSVGGGTVTDTRSFAPGSTRPTYEKTQGKTASGLSGALDLTRTHVTKRTYGGAGGVDVATLEGPYDNGVNGGEPPLDNTAPKSVFGYYSAGQADFCGLPSTFNRFNLASVTRYIDASRTELTLFCGYDRAGQPAVVRSQSKTSATNTGVDDGFSYNARGQIRTHYRRQAGTTTPSLITELEYDDVGNLTEVRLPSATGQKSGFKYAYDSADRVSSIARGSFVHSGEGWVFTPIHSVAYERDAWGNITKTSWINSLGTTERDEVRKYDAFNRLICVAKPYSSDCATSIHRTERSYDQAGHLLRVRDAQGDDVRYGGPSLPLVAPPEPPNWTFDQFGRVTKVQQEICSHPASDVNGTCSGPTLSTVNYVYDVADNMLSMSLSDSVRGVTIASEFLADDFGGVVKVISPDTGTAKFAYDVVGRVSQSEDARGKKYKFSYDRLGRLSKKTNITAGLPGIDELVYCYDGEDTACGYTPQDSVAKRGRLTSVKDGANRIKYTYDIFGRLIDESRTFAGATAAAITQYSYDDVGRMTSFTTPLGPASAGGLTLFYLYDDAGRVTRVNWSGPSVGGTLVRSVVWSANNELVRWSRGASATSTFNIARDSNGRITSTSYMPDLFTTLISETYAYANDGNVSKIPSTVATPNILHDSLGRITQDRATSGVQEFGYDDAGNRRTHTNSATYQFMPSNSDRLQSAESRSLLNDAAGNVTCWSTGAGCTGTTTSLSYTDEGRVGSISTSTYGPTNYVRDHRGLRVQKAGAGGAGTYFYDQEGQLSHFQGPVIALTGPPCRLGSSRKRINNETYLHLDGRPTAVVKSYVQTACGGSTYSTFVVEGIDYYYTDKMSMPRAIISDASGAITGQMTFDAFANPISSSGTFNAPFRFPGQQALSLQEGGPTTSSGGLHENWNRVYDSVLGRYLQADPILSPLDPKSDPFGYSKSSPLALIDPMGLEPKLCCRKINMNGSLGSTLAALSIKHCAFKLDDGTGLSWIPFWPQEDGSWTNGFVSQTHGWWDRQYAGQNPRYPDDLAIPDSDCSSCTPKRGCGDPTECLKQAAQDYPLAYPYKALARNSNTFAGTLFRKCCKGWRGPWLAPGWNRSPPGVNEWDVPGLSREEE